MKNLRLFAVVGLLAIAIAACGGSDAVAVDGAWARTSPAMATAGAAYMNLTASEDDALVSASVDSSIAATVEVHEVVMAEPMDSDESTDDMEGMGEMMMQEVESISLPAGETVPLEPGGYHIMLLDLAEPLEIGQTFDVTLNFENAGEQTVTVEVMDSAP